MVWRNTIEIYRKIHLSVPWYRFAVSAKSFSFAHSSAFCDFRKKTWFRTLCQALLMLVILSEFYNLHSSWNHHQLNVFRRINANQFAKICLTLDAEFSGKSYFCNFLEHLEREIYQNSNINSYTFSIKNFLSKCDQICSFLQIWSHLLKKFVMENFIFCVIFET